MESRSCKKMRMAGIAGIVDVTEASSGPTRLPGAGAAPQSYPRCGQEARPFFAHIRPPLARSGTLGEAVPVRDKV